MDSGAELLIDLLSNPAVVLREREAVKTSGKMRGVSGFLGCGAPRVGSNLGTLQAFLDKLSHLLPH